MVTILLMLAVLIIVGHVLVCFEFRSSSCVYLSANCSDMFRYVGGAVIGLFFLVHVFLGTYWRGCRWAFLVPTARALQNTLKLFRWFSARTHIKNIRAQSASPIGELRSCFHVSYPPAALMMRTKSCVDVLGAAAMSWI